LWRTCSGGTAQVRDRCAEPGVVYLQDLLLGHPFAVDHAAVELSGWCSRRPREVGLVEPGAVEGATVAHDGGKEERRQVAVGVDVGAEKLGDHRIA
jgi:hypothetical protein